MPSQLYAICQASAGLTVEMVRAAAEIDASATEVQSMVELFQWLLPELAVNVAFFRA